MANIKYPRYRIIQWLDTEPEEPEILFGIQTQREKGDSWFYVAENNKPLLSKSETEIKAKIKTLRKNDQQPA